MASILFVNQCYWPDRASTGQHLTDLAEHLARAGDDVHVLCARGRYAEGGGASPTHGRRAGVHIRRLPATRFGKRRAIGRFADYLSFHVLAAASLLFGRRPDVLVTLTTPPLIGLVGAVIARIRRTRHVCFVMDLHPDAEFAHGMLRRASIVGRVLEGLSAWHLRAADRCVALGPRQAELLREKGVRAERITEIPVWSGKDEVTPVEPEQNPLRLRLGWEDRFVVMYSGNAGLAHRFDELLEAARALAETDPSVLFAFVGHGPRTEEIRDDVERSGLTNVAFLDYFARTELCHSLTAADVHFVSLRAGFEGVAVPGKLYGALAAGRPVLFVGSETSDTARHLAAARAGWTVAPEHAAELTYRIRELRGNPELRARLGAEGRRFFLEHHEREVCCERWRALLDEVANAGRRAPAPETPRTAPT